MPKLSQTHIDISYNLVPVEFISINLFFGRRVQIYFRLNTPLLKPPPPPKKKTHIIQNRQDFVLYGIVAKRKVLWV